MNHHTYTIIIVNALKKKGTGTPFFGAFSSKNETLVQNFISWSSAGLWLSDLLILNHHTYAIIIENAGKKKVMEHHFLVIFLQKVKQYFIIFISLSSAGLWVPDVTILNHHTYTIIMLKALKKKGTGTPFLGHFPQKVKH